MRRISMSMAVLLVGALLTNAVYAKDSLPEYYGIYAVDGGRLVEIKIAQDIEKSQTLMGETFFGIERLPPKSIPDVYFIIFSSQSPNMEDYALIKLKFVRNQISVKSFNPRDFSEIDNIESLNIWMGSSPKLSFKKVEWKGKPVAGQPTMLQLVPTQSLSPGLYGFVYSGEVEFWGYVPRLIRVGSDDQIEEFKKENCVDRCLGFLMSDYLPCSEVDRLKATAEEQKKKVEEQKKKAEEQRQKLTEMVSRKYRINSDGTISDQETGFLWFKGPNKFWDDANKSCRTRGAD